MVWMMIGGHSGAATARKLVFNGPGGRAGGLVTLVGISLILAIPLGWVGGCGGVYSGKVARLGRKVGRKGKNGVLAWTMWRDSVDEWRGTVESGVIWLMYGAIRLMNDAIRESVASYDLVYKKSRGTT